MNNRNNLLHLFFCVAFILIISGCAQLSPNTNPLLDKKAFLQAQSFNQHILASKGTGWLKLETQTKVDKFKIVWAAVFPNKIRITFLIFGHPIETIIATGEKITFFSHTGEHSKYSYYSKDPNMEDYIHVPVKMSEMILVLLGRFPVKLLHEMTVKRYKSYDFDDIPVEIEIKDMDGGKLILEITNFQVNPPIKESVFQLTESR